MDARSRLRERIRDKKNQRGGTARDGSSSKIQDALLNVAGDDADMLKLAQQALKDPLHTTQLLKSLSASSASTDRDQAIKPASEARHVEEEEEDLPESMKV